MAEASGVVDDKDRARVMRVVRQELRDGEQVLAILPFTQTAKRPRPPGEKRSDKIVTGVYQSTKRYRPLVVTNRRLLVLDAGRAGVPRALLAHYPRREVTVGEVTPGKLGIMHFALDLPDIGTVPFEGGRKEHDEVLQLGQLLGST